MPRLAGTRRSLASLVAGATLISTGGSARIARADSERLPFVVEVADDSPCPGAERFSSQLLARTQRVRPATERNGALVFRLNFLETGGIVGGLNVLEADGTETAREVRGTTCEEVTSGLALIAAVLVDPNASTAEIVAPVPAPAEPSQPARALPPPPVQPGLHEAAAEGERAINAPRTSQTGASRWHFGTEAGLLLQSGVAPEAAAGLSLAGNAERRSTGLWRPFFGLTLNRTLTTRVEAQGGVAELQWTAARLGVCPLAWQSGALMLRPCGLFDAGVLRGDGRDTQRPDSATSPWLAVGASGRVEVFPVESWAILFEPAVVVPLIRQRFYFDPEGPPTVAYDVPAVGLAGRLAVAGWFE